MDSTTILLIVGLGVEALGLYLFIMGRVDKRFSEYVRKGEQDIVNSQTTRDIGDIKTSLEKISDKVERMVADVPGIIQRVIREEMR